MTGSPSLSRRAALMLAGAALLAPKALAAPTVAFPLRIAVARLGKTGLARIGADQQAIWTAMALRLGGLVDAIEPVQPSSLLAPTPPEADGGKSAQEQGLAVAAELECSQLVIYATEQPSYQIDAPQGWLGKALANVRDVATPDRMMGEALMLDAAGAVIARATTDVPPRFMIFGPEPESETVKALAARLERRLQAMAGAQYAASRSIADGVR